MMKLTILLAVTVIAQQAYCDESQRMYRGNVARPGQCAHQVSFQVNGQHTCGGSMISNRHVLTYGGCVQQSAIPYTKVVTGSTNLNNGERHCIQHVQTHPNNQIAVVTLKQPVQCNNVQHHIPIASQNYATCNNPGIISGWQQTSTNQGVSQPLQYYEVVVMSQKNCPEYCQCQCQNTNENYIYTRGTSGDGVCQGEMGAPLVINNELAGITCGRTTTGELKHYNVYMSRDFITEACQSGQSGQSVQTIYY